MAPTTPRPERPAMSEYGVPEDLDGVLPWAWAAERLAITRNYWVVTVDPAARPHAMPVWGYWREDDQTFWFSCAPSAFKARNLATNPHVVIGTEDTVEVVSLEGRAVAVDADRGIAEAWAAKYEDDPDAAAEMADFFADSAVFRVDPVKAFGLIERPDEFGPRATRWVW